MDIKTPKVERVLLRQFHHSREFVTGTLCLTDRHLIFTEPTGAKETWVLHHHINSLERLPLTTRGYPLVIDTKTFQQLHLIIPRESDCLDIMATIKMLAQPESFSQLYAFQYRPKGLEVMKQTSGWALYDSQGEYGRMGLPNPHWKHTSINLNYELCETYSAHLYVPAEAEKSTVLGSAKFRSRGRLPALSYYHAPKKSALCRCSQPLVGLRSRSLEDEQMIQAIIDANPNNNFIYLIDTRPKINAMANKAAGKGYESTGNYTNVVYQFYNIENIHVMRGSLQKMIEASCSPQQSVSGLLQGLESSGWLKHIHLILEASMFTVKAMQDEGVSVLVHCSDGWDRTAQTCALTSLLLDQYYRSLHGFMILIEKEWLAFGHKFSTRSGHLAGDARDTSPIFTQFLECVWQVMVQFPTAFQFNEHFLLTLHDHLHSCQFGTFLGNCEKERMDNRFSEETYSFWGYVWAHLDDFINPLYRPSDSDVVLRPNTDIPHLSFWRGLYCRHISRHHPSELVEEALTSLRQQNNCLEDHIKFLQQHISELKKNLAHFNDACTSVQAPPDPPNHVIPRPSENGPQNITSGDNTRSHESASPNSLQHSHSTEHGSHQSNDCSLTKPAAVGSLSPGSPPAHPTSNPDSKTLLAQSITANSSTSQEAARDSGIEQSYEQSPGPPAPSQDRTTLSPAPNMTIVGETRVHFNPTLQDGGSATLQDGGSVTLQDGGKTENKSKAPLTPHRSLVDDAAASNSSDSDEDLAVQRRRERSATALLSPLTYSSFKDHLEHIPEMNLPWQPMRGVHQCGCGTTFSFAIRKYHCSHCGVVVCGTCGGNHAPIPFHASSKPQRVCKACFKLMRRRMQDLQQLMSS